MNKPIIILVDPQMGENIGATARAMFNFGLDELRIVRPRDGWPSEPATANAAGALERMPPVLVFDTLQAALADIHFVLATTARTRDMVKPVFTPQAATMELKSSAGKSAIVFGGERAGLTNDDVALCHGIITIPTNPDFSSLNLGQSVLLMAWEYLRAHDQTPPQKLETGDSFPVEQLKTEEFFVRLEQELDKGLFFKASDMRPTIMRNIRNMFLRGRPTDQEVRTLHGIVSALTGKKYKNLKI